MKTIKFLLCVLFLFSLSVGQPPVSADEAVGPQLQKLSVNVFCPGSYREIQGSGTIFLSEVFLDRETEAMSHSAAFILTAHHVVRDLREVKSVIIGGETKQVVRYGDAQIIQEQVENGRAIGEIKYDAKILSVDTRRDIALLRVRKGDFSSVGAAFYLGDIPPVGTEVYHCGAPGGKDLGGTSSLTAGIISRVGVRIPGFGGGSELGIFDQTDTAALGGSSGGMLTLKSDGRFIGMITLGIDGGDNFHWIVPARAILEWSDEAKVRWLFDPLLNRPTEADIDDIPLELHTKPGTFKGTVSGMPLMAP